MPRRRAPRASAQGDRAGLRRTRRARPGAAARSAWRGATRPPHTQNERAV